MSKKTIGSIIEEKYINVCENDLNVERYVSNLETLLNQVGGNGVSIISNLRNISAEEFVDTLYRKGITFKLVEGNK